MRFAAHACSPPFAPHPPPPPFSLQVRTATLAGSLSLPELSQRFADSLRPAAAPRAPLATASRLTNEAVLRGTPLPYLLNPAFPVAICRG